MKRKKLRKLLVSGLCISAMVAAMAMAGCGSSSSNQTDTAADTTQTTESVAVDESAAEDTLSVESETAAEDSLSAESETAPTDTIAEKLEGTWTIKGVTGPELYNSLNEGEEVSTDDLDLDDASSAGLVRYSYKFDGNDGGEWIIECTNGNMVDSVELTYSIQGASATHCDGIDVEIGGGGGDRVLYYDSANDQLIAGYDVADEGGIDYTIILTRAE